MTRPDVPVEPVTEVGRRLLIELRRYYGSAASTPSADAAFAEMIRAIEAEARTPAADAPRLAELRAAVREYIEADDAMPEFADAQRMPTEEWDTLNRRWQAARAAVPALMDTAPSEPSDD